MSAVTGPKPNLQTPAEITPYVPTGTAEASRALIEPPAELSDAAQVKWRLLISDLAEMAVYRESDSIFLIELCEGLAMLERYRRRLVALDDFDLGSPEAKVLRTGYTDFHRVTNQLADNFGLTPVARQRLGLMKIQGTSLLKSLGVET